MTDAIGIVGSEPHSGQHTFGASSLDTTRRGNTEGNGTLSESQTGVPSKTIAAGTALAAGIGLGALFKDGVNQGFTRFGNLTNSLSNIISVVFSLLFPFVTLDNERAGLQGKQNKDDLLTRMTYTAASLGFTPNTWGEPLKMGTRSKAHMIAALMNMPHMGYTFLTYTGGRLMGFIKSLQKRFLGKDLKSKINENRIQEEFEALYRLGNLGSAQASVIPMAGQFVLGWETLLDIFKGNFGSAWERFKHEPVSVALGTCFNSWMYPFEYVSKIFDTTIRTAESVDQFENAFSENSKFISMLKGLKKWWHDNSKNQNTTTGKFLKFAREASKIEALLFPPIGMVSVVLPTINRFLRGEFWNKEAQEMGGTVAFFDKVFNVGAMFSHLYTWVYALNVRMPQFITTSTFYISTLINKVRGLDLNSKDYHNNPRYIDPNDIRDRVFGWSPIKRLSNWAANWLDHLDFQLHPDSPHFIKDRWVIDVEREEKRRIIDPNSISQDCILEKDENTIKFIDPATREEKVVKKITGDGTCRHIRGFHRAMAEEVCYLPVREKLYKKLVDSTFEDKYLIIDDKESSEKPKGMKPSDHTWGEKLSDGETKKRLIEDAKQALINYLRDSQLLAEDKIEEFLKLEYEGVGKSNGETCIKKEVEKLIESEIASCLKPKEEKPESRPIKIESDNLLKLFTNPRDLFKVLKLKLFHVTNTFLPLWIQGFVKVVDYGKNGEPLWLRNIKATESGIREGDIKQACDREYLPVVAYAFQSMGKGLATIVNLFKGNFSVLFAGEEH